MNSTIRDKNKAFLSHSPKKHKYAWGVDQHHLEMKPNREKSKDPKPKLSPEKRRQIIGLDKIEEERLKKLAESIIFSSLD